MRSARCAAEILARDPRIQLVYLFGSVLDPDRPAPRDIDIAVVAIPALAVDELLRLRADLLAATRVTIDLISLDTAPVVLAREVVDTGLCLYARDEDIETAFVTRTRARFWDFAPYRTEQWRLTGRRVDERLSGH